MEVLVWQLLGLIDCFVNEANRCLGTRDDVGFEGERVTGIEIVD